MDLSTLGKRVKDETYMKKSELQSFVTDLHLIFKNAKKFNNPWDVRNKLMVQILLILEIVNLCGSKKFPFSLRLKRRNRLRKL